METSRPLADTHALVTGGGRGIGAAVVRELARLGASVSLLGRTPGPLASLAAELSEAYPEQSFHAAPADVTEPGPLAAAVSAAREALGPITILVNNAGAAWSAPFHKMDEAHWQGMLDVNLTSAYRCSRLVADDLREAGWGRIVNVASTAGLTGYAYVVAYCAAKHGMIGLTRALAAEWAASGVTVNAVCPGYVDTDLVTRSVEAIREKTGRSEADVLAHMASQNPTGRLVTPEEVASAVGWLCSPAQAQVTGASLPISGGEVV